MHEHRPKLPRLLGEGRHRLGIDRPSPIGFHLGSIHGRIRRSVHDHVGPRCPGKRRHICWLLETGILHVVRHCFTAVRKPGQKLPAHLSASSEEHDLHEP